MNRKALIFLFLIIVAREAALSQSVIMGKVLCKKQPIPGASITLKDTYDGTTSDSSGNFKFITSEKGEHLLVITAVGYKMSEQKVTISNQPIELGIELKEEVTELNAVTITAGTFEAGDKKRAAVLNSIDVATTAGSNADISAALKTLPGTQQVGEQEGLFVRGGAGYETKQFIDGNLVNNPYFTSVPDIASRGRFSPFLFKGTVFSTGGYSALYGQALSSVLLLESIDLPEKSEIDATISPLVVGLGTQQLAKNKKSSYGINYSYVNVGLYFSLIKQTPDYFKMPQFHNGDANFRIKTKNGGMIKYYTTFAFGDLGLRRPDIDSDYLKDAFSLKNNNWYNNLTYKENLGKGWKMNLGASFSTNLDKIQQQVQDKTNLPKQFPSSQFWMNSKNFSFHNLQNLSLGRAVIEKSLGGLSAIRFGGEYWYSDYRPKFNDTLYMQIDNYTAAFAEGSIYLSKNLAAQVGARFEHSSIINRSDIAPRISLAYKAGKRSQLSVAYGIFYQKPESQQLYVPSMLGFTKAIHYVLDYQRIYNQRTLRVEAYYKKYEDLIKQMPVSYNYYDYNNAGSGYAKGIDLFFRDKKTIKDFDYWISYSYIDTKREYLNYPVPLQPSFVANHTASIVTKKFFTDLKAGFNATYSWASGRPYYNILPDANNKFYIADQGKTIDYNSLSFSAEWVPSVGNTKAKSFLVLFATVSNLLGSNQVYGYNYSYNGFIKSPIMPPAKRFYFVGLFLSWGVDRSQDAINNNL
ncbi:MAG: TonB-dependent receptor [Bacteroidetes bacterium]|nr:TonB-dependent receptor [Bacteroidota bacterium]MBS1931611.1 TonB-dependent receptor [Bacteroidota bacterium]